MKKNRWIVKYYGSRRGFLFTHWYRILYFLGRYRQYSNRNIDWLSVKRIVFICKGNICRSAYAEAVARSLGISAISCGLDTIEDAPANKDAILVAKKLGFNLEHHKTKPIMYLALKKTDLLVVMEPWQAVFLNKNLMRAQQCVLLGLCGIPKLPYIQDPYGSSEVYFYKCFSYIQDSVQTLVRKINH